MGPIGEGGFSTSKLQRSALDVKVLIISGDFWCPLDGKEGQTVYRSYTHVLNPGLQDLVPELASKSIPPFSRSFDDKNFEKILDKDPLQPNGPPQTSLVEIGPRFVLTPIRIFEGAFGGATVFSNPGTCSDKGSRPDLTSLGHVQNLYLPPCFVPS